MDLKNASQRGVNFDYIMWVFTRLSALGMYLLILIAILAVIIVGARQNMTLPGLVRWIFSPVVGVGSNAHLRSLAGLENLFWKGLGFLLILAAGSHGFHGILSVEEDYLLESSLIKPLRYLIFSLWVVLSIIAAYVILTS